MRLRITGAVVAATAFATGGAAYAAKPASKPVCLQITDETGDANLGGTSTPASQTSSSALDIVSGDIATGKKNLVAAIRVRSMDAESMTIGGSTYVLSWTSAGLQRSLTYRTYVDQAAKGVFDPDGSVAWDEVPVVTQVNGTTITFVMPRRLEPALKKAGAALSGLKILSSFSVNREGSSTAMSMDSASSPRTYTDGQPTCLKGV